LEDNETDAELIADWLQQAGIDCQLDRVDTEEEYQERLAGGGYDLILADQTTPTFNGQQALALAHEIRPEVPFIFVSGTIDEEVAIDALQNGATDYVLKHRLTRLVPAVERAIGEQQRRRELVRANRLLETQGDLLDLASDMILIRDMDQRIVFWNRGAERAYGWGREGALGQKVPELLRTEFPEAPRHLEAQLLGSGHWQGELVHHTADGRRLVVSSRWTLRRDAKGEPTAVLVIDTDLTERRRLEAQLRQAQKLEDLGTLVGGIAHDFNNTLNIIIGCSDLLNLRAVGPEETGQMLQHILTAADRGAGLVRQLLTFSRQTETKLAPLALNEVVEEVLRMLIRTFPKSIEFSKALDPEAPRILADSSQIYQVLLNLSVNARDAMPEGGRLHFTSSCVPASMARAQFPEAQPLDHVCLAVSDTGTGMDSGTLARVFEPFFTTKGVGQGTGLGLAVVYGVVQSHHGFIDVQSAPGRGTTFRLFFPIAAAEQLASAPALPESEIVGGTETLLLVEDEEMVRELIASLLERRGYRVLTAADGQAAMEIFSAQRDTIDLVISDLNLPQMSGAQLTSLMLGLKPTQRVLICTGYIEPPVRRRLQESGVCDFLLKPYRPGEIFAKIRQTLDAPA
jgi:two-component system, cell cycle sensor histidine kinase and response regulator CckA